MMLRKWEQLPENMQTKEVREYYDSLKKKQVSLACKRIFDIVISFVMLIVLFPVFLILAIAIKVDSKGPVFFRQIRVTQYGKQFRIFKFRTMVQNAEQLGTQFTVGGDKRLTKVGAVIRKYRLDEISQLIDILRGTMTFVGTRPEVPRYTDKYTPEMMATLLLPAGVTSLCSIYYKDEDRLIDAADDVDRVYVEDILPGKMVYNLRSIKELSCWKDIKVMFMTAAAICGKEYSEPVQVS